MIKKAAEVAQMFAGLSGLLIYLPVGLVLSSFSFISVYLQVCPVLLTSFSSFLSQPNVMS